MDANGGAGGGGAGGGASEPPAKRAKVGEAVGGGAYESLVSALGGGFAQAPGGGVATASESALLDYNAFLQAMPAEYTALTPAMAATMGVQGADAQLQSQHLQFLQSQRQFAVTLAAQQQVPQQPQQRMLRSQHAQQQQLQQQQLQQQRIQQQRLLQLKQQQLEQQAAVMAAIKQQNSIHPALPSKQVEAAALQPQPQAPLQRPLQVPTQFVPQSPPPIPLQPTPSGAAAAPQDQAAADHPCAICREKGGGVFTCTSGCGLHAHPSCIGEQLLFPHSAGLMCGNCFAMKQNRSSNENLQTGGANGLSVRRAVLFINLETNVQGNFDKFGHMASLRLLEIGEIAGYPIKPFAAKFVEPYFERWIREKLSHAGKTPMSVREIFTFLVGLYGLKQACIAHGLKDKLIELVKARNYSTTDFLGWHPSIENPHVLCSSLCQICSIRNPPELKVCGRCYRPLSFPSVFTKFASALLATYYAEQVGMPLGTTCLDVFSHTNLVRASYKGLKPYDPDGTDWDVFADQMRTIFGILDVVSNFGVLQLNPDLFEPELKIITNPSYLNHAMYLMDFEVVAKFLQSMRIFGSVKAAELANMVFVTERFLLIKQLSDGSWLKAGGSFADQYKSTAVCAKALANPVFQGYGPVSSDFHRLLEKWAKAAPNSKYPNVPNLKILADGVKVKPPTRASLKKLESFYRRQLAPDSESNPLERLVTERLRKILPSKRKAEAEKSDARRSKQESDAASGATDSEDPKMEPKKSARRADADAVKSEEEPESGSLDEDDDGVVDVKDEPAQTEDDALISMSLNEELDIFDGLKFEGGGVIDVASASSQPRQSASGEESVDAAEDGDGDPDMVDTDGAETVRPDEEEEDEEEMGEMYDDDDDENIDGHELEDGEDLGEGPQELDEPSAGDVGSPEQMMDEHLAFAENASGDFSLDM